MGNDEMKKPKPKAEPERPAKKTVLLEPSGIYRIVGEMVEPYPQMIKYEDDEPYSLLLVKPRFIVYRQAIRPKTGKLGDFHPDQR